MIFALEAKGYWQNWMDDYIDNFLGITNQDLVSFLSRDVRLVLFMNFKAQDYVKNKVNRTLKVRLTRVKNNFSTQIFG